MKTRYVRRYAALSLALPIALSACSSSTDGAEDATEQSSTSATATHTASPDAPTTPEQKSDSNSEGKPAKEQYHAGLVAMLNDLGYSRQSFLDMGVSETAIDTYFSCIVDETYDDVSAGFISAVVDNKPGTALDPSDGKILNDGISTCVATITGQSPSNSPK